MPTVLDELKWRLGFAEEGDGKLCKYDWRNPARTVRVELAGDVAAVSQWSSQTDTVVSVSDVVSVVTRLMQNP